MSRTLTTTAVNRCREFIAVAEGVRNAIDALEKVDAVESEELLGCTLIKVARIFDKQENIVKY